MKTNERMLRYLSGIMSPDEIKKFEDELSTSADLNAEFSRMREAIKTLGSGMEWQGNAEYFNNLIPRVRVRVEKKKSNKIYSSIKYLAPAFTIIVLYFLIPFRNYSPLEEQVRDLNDNAQIELLNLIDESVLDYENDEVIESAISEELDQVNIGEVDAKYIRTDDLLNNLSEEEVSSIYNTILNKKIL